MVKRAMTTMALVAGGVFAPAAPAGDMQTGGAAREALPPCTVRISPLFQPVVRQLLDASPTFRAQMRRIADARHVRVAVEPVAGGVGGCCTLARTVFNRYSTGALLARVEIAIPLTATEYAELLGHEFEHVVEQIDNVDVRRMARGGDDAHRVAEDTFETRRAAEAGRAIAREAEASGMEPQDWIRQGLSRAMSGLRRLFGRDRRPDAAQAQGRQN